MALHWALHKKSGNQKHLPATVSRLSSCFVPAIFSVPRVNHNWSASCIENIPISLWRSTPKSTASLSSFWLLCNTLWTVEFPNEAFLSPAAGAQVSVQTESDWGKKHTDKIFKPSSVSAQPFQSMTGELLSDPIIASLPRGSNSPSDPTQLALATPLA